MTSARIWALRTYPDMNVQKIRTVKRWPKVRSRLRSKKWRRLRRRKRSRTRNRGNIWRRWVIRWSWRRGRCRRKQVSICFLRVHNWRRGSWIRTRRRRTNLRWNRRLIGANHTRICDMRLLCLKIEIHNAEVDKRNTYCV